MRNKNLLTKGLSATLSLALVASLVTGCGKSSDASSTSKDGVTKIRVGSGTTYEPYCYLDENGDAVGLEYDLLKAIDEKLPQYEFEYQSLAFDNLLLSVDSDKLDFVAHQYSANPEREEKYLLSDETYTVFDTYITVLADNNDINSLDDLQGKTVWGGGVTSEVNTALVNYNNEHSDNPIVIVNSDDTTYEYQTENLKNGAWASSISQALDVAGYNEEAGTELLKTVGDPVTSSLTHYIFRKDKQELKEAVDGALKELREDGTLAEISTKWLGGDYTGDGNE